MTVREIYENREAEFLSRYAAKSRDSQGRRAPIVPCPIRTCYQRDRDRILHCKSFRRLKHKTQVFLAPKGDHYRTRLTHTLEVSQIARTISRALYLNEDLTEAIALGHDLGHTPYGHAGERALNAVAPNGFAHYRQSLRVVDVLENDGKGLNLTYEVRNGILCHTKGEEAATLEGRVVRIADRIAYINHDIDDAIRAGVLKNSDIPSDIRKGLGEGRTDRIDTLVMSVIESSTDKPEIKMHDDVFALFDSLHRFMFDRVYTNSIAKAEEGKAVDMIMRLYIYFCEHPDVMEKRFNFAVTDSVATSVCDFIAGMSDNYAVEVYESIFVPKGWMI
ncbi:MAG: deoxyguanosinetriphosphate triphosphohydrolase [Clostridia bacterium]|nr:deoxyguanosinetriphosphate triphosphohydrolase [Clostridia bacterium]